MFFFYKEDSYGYKKRKEKKELHTVFFPLCAFEHI